ncbi:MAG: GTP 3',8-cyclase MoaA [Deltaproteobacteria bacterium]|nr:GTP 3',8-cyclase MoaA [Candidatus Tharpella sp.]
MFRPALQDGHNRSVSYVRISVTDRCNLRCSYCSAPTFSPHSRAQILSYEEILRLVKVLVGLGVDKVRLTGGEPLVRRHLDSLIARLNDIDGINDISLTTNGVLLEKLAAPLWAAGLRRVNVSLDTLNPLRFKKITGRDYFDRVLGGIKAALAIGFTPVKINIVVMRGVNDDELLAFAELTRKYPIHVRFIEYMPIGSSSVWNPADMVSGDQIIEQISTEIAGLEPVVSEFGGPARLYRLPGAPGKIGVITAMSNHFCDSCNRIRVTADGHLRACLLSDKEFPLREVLRAGGDPEKIAEMVRLAVASKSAEHGLACNSERKCARVMSTIGG